MSSIVEQLIQTHGAQVAEQISSRLGIPAEKAAGVLPAVAPLILGGLQRQAREPGGEAKVEEIVDSQGDAGILDDVSGFFARQTAAVGATGELGLGSLGGLLGGAGAAGPLVETIAEKVGISKEKAGEIIPLLAPLVMGFLVKQKASAGTGGAGGSLLTSLLDRDGDGSILDDVAGMLGGGGALGSLLGGGGPAREGGGESAGSTAGDLLGKALGGLLGGKK
ncbi:MAG: DUF937 domain-containing protein [Verrucomicrobiales bacterium]|nr:DUF937 domain-containing protein [Verrucomicrobiales bacterium]